MADEDAGIELIRAMFDALRATSAVTDLVTRFLDRPPGRGLDESPTEVYDYVSIGPTVAVPDDVDCIEAEELTIQLDVWSSGSDQAFSSIRCRQIAKAIKRRLHNAELDLPTNALVTLTWAMTRFLDDPNPAIHHAAVLFTAVVETP